MTNRKKIPLRTCVACRQQKEKQELMRVVCTKEGDISVALSSRQNGRGAYVCKNAECIKKAQKTGAFNRAFSREVPDEVFCMLLAEAEN